MFRQTMIERLLSMLNDMDYRVRLSLARRIGVLFQTWDGHEELFQDIWLVAYQMISISLVMLSVMAIFLLKWVFRNTSLC